jgi:hypothetical protein
MRLRKLRIAWSVMCGMLCLLLLVLWVRSYRWTDAVQYHVAGKYMAGITSRQGVLCGGWTRFTTNEYVEEWFGSSRWHTMCRPSEPLRPDFPRWRIGVEPVEYFAPTGIAPHWFPVVLLAALAVVPWTRWSPWRFSLRTLLIATTLVSLALGTIVWLTHQ